MTPAVECLAWDIPEFQALQISYTATAKISLLNWCAKEDGQVKLSKITN